MDYRTFLTTAYLAQGRADEFARASVSDRKKVLADILDLSRYERLEAMAKERMQEAAARETDAEREIRAIDAELANEDRYHLALEAAQKRRAEVEAEVAALQADYEKLLTQIETLDAQEQRAQDYETRTAEFVEEIAGNARALAEVERRVAAAQQVAARRDAIVQAHERFTQLTQQVRPLEERYDAVLALQREAQQLERVIREEFDRLDRERYRVECEAVELEGLAQEVGRYADEVMRLDAEVAAYGDPEARRADADQKRQDAEKRRREFEESLLALRTDHATLKAQADALQKRLDALAGSDAAVCEYCGQDLPPAKRKKALAEAQAEQDALAEQMAGVAAQGREAKKQADACGREAEQWQREAARLDGELRQVATLQARRAQAEQERLRVEERVKTLPEVQRRHQKYVKVLNDKAFAQAEQERLVAVSAQLEKSERVGEQLNHVRQELARYKDAERHLLELEQADGVLATEPARADELRLVIAKRESQIEKARTVIADIRVKTAALPSLRREQAERDARLRASQGEMQAADREIGRQSELLERCAQMKVERVKREEERLAAARERDTYKELVGAFGKKGVQALIIENALPEIEDATNELLGRMTDGAMQVRLVTQKERKSRGEGAIETLDIILSDDMGTRPYEMYSGGEAFRVNFALRVALSKMLARRAGAALQTLIIDEGFGTQDPRGREAIIDALNTITDDFALVLCITHIEELKEAFPTRIEVVKGPAGSTFTLA
jgi:exonuclease SbcC